MWLCLFCHWTLKKIITKIRQDEVGRVVCSLTTTLQGWLPLSDTHNRTRSESSTRLSKVRSQQGSSDWLSKLISLSAIQTSNMGRFSYFNTSSKLIKLIKRIYVIWIKKWQVLKSSVIMKEMMLRLDYTPPSPNFLSRLNCTPKLCSCNL